MPGAMTLSSKPTTHATASAALLGKTPEMQELENATLRIVDLQLAAYNHRDIATFAATYHDDVEIRTMSGGLLYRGKDKLIEQYGAKFAALTWLQATSLKRIVTGNYLVDDELAQSCSGDPNLIDNSIQVGVVYEVLDGLIKSVLFLR